MDRRNFFLMAGTAGLALAAGDAVAQEQRGMAGPGMAARPMENTPSLLEATRALSGKAIDRDLVALAVRGAGTGGAAADYEVDWICGSWYAIYHNTGIAKEDWVDAGKLFGAEFARLPLSQMVAMASKSRFGGANLSLKVDRDGQVFVAG